MIIKRILKALNGKSFDDVILDSEIIKEFSHFLMVLDLQMKKIFKVHVTSVEHRRNI
jgi:hypothetical protein